MAELIHTTTFEGGMNADISPEAMPPNVYRYMLNCSVLSTDDGDVAIVTNIKGTEKVSFALPAGNNKCIGVVLDEETSNLYYALYNSNGYHGWYRYNMTDNAVVPVLQCMIDTNEIDIFGWRETDLILHGNIIGNNLLYWTISNRRDVARKINVRKAMDKTAEGYNSTVLESWTRVYKKSPTNAPIAAYGTDLTKRFNKLFGYQFQFANRFIYDDRELGETSDFSNVPNPDEEYFTGTKGVPEKNNLIDVVVETGDETVIAIEILVRMTNTEGGVSPWMSAVILNKRHHDIASGGTYTYRFFNDGAYSVVDQLRVLRNNSAVPRGPLCQDYAKNALVYANYIDGRAPVDVDVTSSIRYEDVFIDDATQDQLNSPFIAFNESSRGWTAQSWLGGSGYRWVIGNLVIGPDVKPGNVFRMSAVSGNKRISFEHTAVHTDTNVSVANSLYAKFKASSYFSSDYGKPGGYVNPVTTDGSGNAVVSFRIMSVRGEPYWTITTNNGNPVNTVTLKDTGQSLRNIKNGSTIKYGIVYRDEDGRKELVQTSDDMIVSVQTMNELGGIKRPVITLSINHRPPEWATSYSIVRTGDLNRDSYIQFLIQKAILIDGHSDKYYDLVVGSLFTYQQLHPNTILRYEFKKGDRVRLMYRSMGGTNMVVQNVRDFEVISYNEITEEEVTNKIVVDGSPTVQTTSADPMNIGSYININGAERLITGATTNVSYTLDNDYPAEGSSETFPSYRIINKRGVLRVKEDSSFPFMDGDIVEVYTPAVRGTDNGEAVFHEFGMHFNILDAGTENALHVGNLANQTSATPALVEIRKGSSYVRNRELPTNNSTKNPTVTIAVIEDDNYSDFYVSDLKDDGKVNVVDQGLGEVELASRFIHSSTFIEGTQINGLSDFDAINTVDFNDKYGDVRRIVFDDGRMYVFKELKCAWMPIYGNVITDETGTDLLASSSGFFPRSLQFYSWDGGVGNNPESVVRIGTQFFFISVNSGVFARLGGNGVDPVSKIYHLDSEAKRILSVVRRSSLVAIGGGDLERDEYHLTIPEHVDVVYDTAFNANEWQLDDSFMPTEPPTVDAGEDQIITSGVTTLQGSVTPGSTPIVSLQWTQIAGPITSTIVSPGSLTTNVTGLVNGNYVFRLTATDQGGLQGYDDITVLVGTETYAYMGNIDSFRTPSLSEILGGTPIEYAGAGDVEFPAEDISSVPSYMFFAWPIAAGIKSRWKDKFNLLNSGSVGGHGNLFFDIQVVDGYYVVTTGYRTQFINPIILFQA